VDKADLVAKADLDPEKMYKQARLLSDAARHLDSFEPQSDKEQEFTVPAIVLWALASEIALKAMVCVNHSVTTPFQIAKLCQTGVKPHHLGALYWLLTEAQRLNLDTLVKANMPKQQRVVALPDQDNICHIDSQQIKVFPVEQSIQTRSMDFENWRYQYENYGLVGQPTYSQCLAECLLKLLERELPALFPEHAMASRNTTL
jgi:hypothetical protein